MRMRTRSARRAATPPRVRSVAQATFAEMSELASWGAVMTRASRQLGQCGNNSETISGIKKIPTYALVAPSRWMPEKSHVSARKTTRCSPTQKGSGRASVEALAG